MSIFSYFQKTIRQYFCKSSGIILDPKDLPKKLFQFDKMFTSRGNMIVEFGVGKGQFMKNYALQNPHYRFLGVEKVRKWIRHCAERIEKKKIQNVRLIQSTGEEIIEKIPVSSVDEYHILFPDPWPKRRHQQRRIIQKKLIENIHKTLKNSGKLYIATDHKDYYDWMRKVVDPFLNNQFHSINDEKPAFISNYQTKYEKEGRAIYSIHLRKITNS